MYKIISGIAMAGLLVWGASETAVNRSLHARASASARASQEAAASLAAERQSSADAQSQLEQITGVLNTSTAKVASQTKLLADYKTRMDALEMSQAQKQDRAKLAAEQPVIRSNGIVIFPRLLAANGNTLLVNAEYREAFGRKLVFKTGLDMHTYDVDDVHPGALIQLSIDPAAAKNGQAEMDKQKQMLAVMQARAAQSLVAQNAQFIDKQTQQNAAQAAINEQNRQQQFQENLQQQAANAEHLRAVAAKQAADAAMVSAQNPGVYIINQ